MGANPPTSPVSVNGIPVGAHALMLNLGCGYDVRPGYVNMDVVPLRGVDVVHDLLALPWPFADGQFAGVLAKHVLEHVPPRAPGIGGDALVAVMDEIHRVLGPGGTLEVFVPHPQGGPWDDPTHYRALPRRAWEAFTAGAGNGHYTGEGRWRLVRYRARRELRGPLKPYHFEKYLGVRPGSVPVPLLSRPVESHVVLRKEERPTRRCERCGRTNLHVYRLTGAAWCPNCKLAQPQEVAA